MIPQFSGKKISVIGGGAWGTTLAMIASENNDTVKQWTHSQAHRDQLNSTRKNALLPDITLAAKIQFFSEFTEDFFNCDIIIIVVASEYFRQTAKIAASFMNKDTLIVSATKGLEKDSAKPPYDIMLEEIPETMHDNICILSGPNIALEIAKKKPAASVLACRNKEKAEIIQAALSTNYFRIYISTDIQGIELGGILKNIIAIAAGIADGLDLGSNTKSTLMVRGIYEITKLARKLGANPSTLLGLAGMGDLITTCSSPLSRNYQTGFQLAKGRALNEILSELGSVAEGVRTCEIVHKQAKELGVDLPIIEQVYNVLYKNVSPYKAIENLMTRKLKSEFEEMLL